MKDVRILHVYNAQNAFHFRV